MQSSLIGSDKRSVRIDCLKALAIISICLYHIGGGNCFEQAYLGVEVFLPISGYLMMVGVERQILNSGFKARDFIIKQLKRLWPPVLIGAFISLIIGYFVMLPDNFENLAESVVASSIFAENILESVTTKNYWDIVNLYKPLMHLWYIGLLVQVQFSLAIIYALVLKFFKNSLRAIKYTVIVLSSISLILFLLPVFSDADKFYLPFFRYYEVLFGSLIAFIPRNTNVFKKQFLLKLSFYLSLVLMIVIMFIVKIRIKSLAMILIVLFTCYLLLYIRETEECCCLIIRYFAKIGEASYSIYIVHQIIVAFMYYCLFESFRFYILPLFFLAVAFFATIMYLFIEKSRKSISNVKSLIILSTVSTVMIVASMLIYFRAGVVRDVPELDIKVEYYYRGMHSEYCDRPYEYNHDFRSDDKTRVLVLGNSFGRDWVNVLLESSISSEIEISYLPYHNEKDLIGREEILKNRAMAADYVFFVLGADYRDVPDSYLELIPEKKLLVVGNKNFGFSNGIIYSRRGRNDYYDSTINLNDEIKVQNLKMIEKYGDKYIDVLKCVSSTENTVNVFTQDGKFISQDCRHLTKNGAAYISDRIDWDRLFN